MVLAALAASFSGARAQNAGYNDATYRQIDRLSDARKYIEAVEVAKRAVAVAEQKSGPEHPEVAKALNYLGNTHRWARQFAEAEHAFRRAIALRERPPHEPEELVRVLTNLAETYEIQERRADAEAQYLRLLEVREASSGPEHPNVASALNTLAVRYRRWGRYADAEPLDVRALRIREAALGPMHREVATSLNNLAVTYWRMGRLAEAEALHARALAIRETTLGAEHLDTALSLGNLGIVLADQGRLGEAAPLYTRALAIREKTQGPTHTDVALALNNLATLHLTRGRFAEAEPLYKRSIAIYEKTLGTEHGDVALSLNNLATLYSNQNRLEEAEPILRRALSIYERTLGPDHPTVGAVSNNLAGLLQSLGRYDEAEAASLRGLAIAESSLGPDHPQVGDTLNMLGLLNERLGRPAEAETLYHRSLAIRQAAFGGQHPSVATSLNNIAALYRVQGRFGEAEPLLQRALAIHETVHGADHPFIVEALNSLAGLYYVQRDWVRTAEYWRRSTQISVRRAERGVGDTGAARTGRTAPEATHLGHFTGLIKALYRLPASAGIASEAFEAAQRMRATGAATSLVQMAARGADGDVKLAALVRERQDLVEEWQTRDVQRTKALSQAPGQRDRTAEAATLQRLEAIDTRIGRIDGHLAKEFPAFAAMSRPGIATVAQVQADLHPDEALVLFLDTGAWLVTPEETFIWVVTKSDLRWVRAERGSSGLRDDVAALRCGLDVAAWAQPLCAQIFKGLFTAEDAQSGNPLPFDHVRAHGLYSTLFGEVQDLIKDKALLLVPSGALTLLPFNVLVTQNPAAARGAAENHGDSGKSAIAWLAGAHATTILPAVSSLKALRRDARPSAAGLAMIGFGNPLLDGQQKHPQFGAYYAQQARLARERQRCEPTRMQRWATALGLRRRPTAVAKDAKPAEVETRSGIADLAHLRAQTPLPETADELCAVAHLLGADVGSVRLGSRATEREIKALSKNGTLARYRVVHFATHGTIAGQLGGTNEPGLILTPPATSDAIDDGFLSASEIAALKLDADWVILSACNTAGSAEGGETGEALSGLARAFFYAQARALLVSHWEVDSAAAVKLVTGAIGALARDASIGRAEALRRAMRAMFDEGTASNAHPAMWAPFAIVGEGAARRG